jgi:hypothetical protein
LPVPREKFLLGYLAEEGPREFCASCHIVFPDESRTP